MIGSTNFEQVFQTVLTDWGYPESCQQASERLIALNYKKDASNEDAAHKAAYERVIPVLQQYIELNCKQIKPADNINNGGSTATGKTNILMWIAVAGGLFWFAKKRGLIKF